MNPRSELNMFVYRLIVCLAFVSCSTTQESMLYTYRGASVLPSDLAYDAQKRLYEIELNAYEKRMELIRELVVERHLRDLASRDGKSADEVRLAYFPEPTISEDERRKYFEQIKASIPYSYDTIKSELDSELTQEKADGQRIKFLKMAEQDADIRIGFDKPKAPKAETVGLSVLDSFGPSHADASVVLFADFACPHCRAVAPKFRSLQQKFPNVRFGFRSFLLRMEGRSLRLAIEAECASEQGKFWSYHDWIFLKNEAKSFDANMQEEMGLNSERFASCVSSPVTKSKIELRQQSAVALGISGTPTFFVNGRAVATSESLAELERVIEDEIR